MGILFKFSSCDNFLEQFKLVKSMWQAFQKQIPNFVALDQVLVFVLLFRKKLEYKIQ